MRQNLPRWCNSTIRKLRKITPLTVMEIMPIMITIMRAMTRPKAVMRNMPAAQRTIRAAQLVALPCLPSRQFLQALALPNLS